MTTSTNRLHEELQARELAADDAEQRDDVQALAGRRYEDIAASGQTIRWRELRAYLRARVAGRKARRPAARKLTVRARCEDGYRER
ncbi:MAG: hypothetical protein WD886_02300 [Burkholderiales bacterium]